ncbi:MAG TPA: tail fiber domain-containing protein, partial [Terriglobales bacterium]|nr:tail fiber domain-containing protein [Terriglobales bacterium]
GSLSTAAGGYNNTASASYAVVGGGQSNNAGGTVGDHATVSGGQNNNASGSVSTVSGGLGNTASSFYATVSGGQGNQATDIGATVPGGQHNIASGLDSFAAGNNAQASHLYSFVWCDNESSPCTDNADKEFVVVAQGSVQMYSNGGVFLRGGSQLCTLTGASGGWNCSSDRALKSGFHPVDGLGILQRVAQLPISTWSFRSDSSGSQHLGPMAQDFYAAFHLGNDDKSIGTTDAQGVALAAIQGLNQKLEQNVQQLQAQLQSKDAQITALKSDIEQLRQLSQGLMQRLAEVEQTQRQQQVRLRAAN